MHNYGGIFHMDLEHSSSYEYVHVYVKQNIYRSNLEFSFII